MELKKCPFCGGESDLFSVKGRNGYFVFVQCTMCNSQSKTFSLGSFRSQNWENSQASKNALSVWNTRVGETNG